MEDKIPQKLSSQEPTRFTVEKTSLTSILAFAEFLINGVGFAPAFDSIYSLYENIKGSVHIAVYFLVKEGFSVEDAVGCADFGEEVFQSLQEGHVPIDHVNGTVR